MSKIFQTNYIITAVILVLLTIPVQLRSEEVKVFSLDECVEDALINHPGLLIYESKLEQKKSRFKGTRADSLPRIDAVASWDRLSYITQAKQRYIGDSENDYQADIVVTQLLYTGGGITSRRRAARYGFEAAEQTYQAARNDLVCQVKSSYYKLLFAQEILSSKKDLLNYAELAYKTALDLHKRTKIPREETLLRIKIQVDQVKQELVAAETGLILAKKILLNSMGADHNMPIEILPLKDSEITTQDMKQNIEQNPLILKTSREIEESAELLKLARSGYYPFINARYSYGYEWGRLPIEKNRWVAGISAGINILNWGKTKSEVDQAHAYKKEVKSFGKLILQKINLDWAAATAAYVSAGKRFEIAEISLQEARRSLDLFERRYRDALATSFELLDSHRAFAQSQINYSSALLDMRLARAEMEKIAGIFE